MEYHDNLLRERLLKLIHEEDISQRAFALAINRNPANTYQVLTGKRNFPRGFIEDVHKAFPRVNKDWLYFGEGEIYGGEKEKEYVPTDTKPRLPRTMTDGHLTDYFEGAKRSLCQEKPIVTQFPNYDFSAFLKTDRMAPYYRRGDELFFKKTSIIEWGNCYLLDTAEGPKFKRVYEDKDGIRCVSYNREEYPDFVIPRILINGFYKCVGFLRIL